MKDIDQLFRRAFSEACGIKIEDVLRSKRYQKLHNRARSLFARYGCDSDEGIALRAGHLAMGQLLNTAAEAQALQNARASTPIVKAGIKYRALIQCLGEAVIDEAANCLPDEVKQLAVEWQSASAERQIEIAKELYFLFSVENRKKREEISTQNWMDDIHWKRGNNCRRQGAELPRVYGKWQSFGHLANCQGKTQMIAAFGKLAKTPVLGIAPVVQAGNMIGEWRREIIKMLKDDIEERIEFPDPSFMDSMAANTLSEMHNRSDLSFHLCAALQLSDGRWVMIDSHALDWGVLASEYEIDGAYSLLRKYREVLPGLKIAVHDHGIWKKFHRQAIERAEQLIQRSKELEKTLGPGPGLDAMIQALAQSDELDFFLREFHECDDGREFKLPDHSVAREYAAMVLVAGDSLLSLSQLFDPNFAKKKLGMLLTTYHCIAINGTNDRIKHEGVFTHPVCELANPEHEIAMSILNSLAIDAGEYNTQFFLQNSFCQTHMFNALTDAIYSERRKGYRDLAIAAAKVLARLPFVHELNRRKLSSIKL